MMINVKYPIGGKLDSSSKHSFVPNIHHDKLKIANETSFCISRYVASPEECVSLLAININSYDK